MDPNDIKKLESLFHALADIPRGAERDAAALRLSEGDADLARKALDLVDSEEKAEAANDAARQATTASRLYGNYRTTRLLGTGGMGAVYLAERADGQFQQTVALKVIAPHVAGGAFRERFLAERQILAGLSHPNITKLLDGGVTAEGTPYLVMEYVPGLSLDAYCDENKLALRERLDLFLKVCAPVAYAHRSLVVHRDLKPSNILVTGEGQPMLVDFGTAKLLLGTENNATVTSPLLTIRYSSPEQRSRAPITTSTDIFSLGVILYELLTGAWPFGDPSSPEQMLERFARETPMTSPQTAVTEEASVARSATLRSLKGLLAGDLSNILTKALAPAPEQRYESVEALSADIGNWLAGLPVNAKAPTFPYRTGKFLRRNWLMSTAAAVLIGGLMAATLFSMYQARIARAEALKARTVSRFLADLLETQNPLVSSTDITLAEVIEHARQNLTQFDNQPSVQAELHLRLGSAYINMWSWKKAEEELRKAVESSRRAGDSEKLAVAESELGATLTAQGRSSEGAEQLCRDALNRIRTTKSPDALSVYLVLGNYALTSWQLHGHSPEIVSLTKEAIAAAKSDPSVPGWRPTTGQIDLAKYLIEEGRYTEAEVLLKEALDWETRSGAPGLAMGTALSLLGNLQTEAGDLDGAERYQRQYVDQVIRVVGPRNERVSNARILWAMSLARLGRHREAVQECRAGLEIARKTLPAGSARIAVPLSACAFVLNEASQAVEAEHNARDAIRLQGSGQPNPGLVLSTTELGVSLLKQHRYQEAIPELTRGEQLYLTKPGFGPKNFFTKRASAALAAARAHL